MGDERKLTLHCLQVLHVQGAGAAGTSCGSHWRKQVSSVRATVTREQRHLVVVLSCGQACMRGWSRGTARSTKMSRGNQKVRATDEKAKVKNGRSWRGKEGERRISERGETTGRAAALHHTSLRWFTLDDNRPSKTLIGTLVAPSLKAKQLHREHHLKWRASRGVTECLLRDYNECALVFDWCRPSTA